MVAIGSITVDAHIAYIHACNQRRQSLGLSLANVVLQLGQHGHRRHGRHILEHALFPGQRCHRTGRRAVLGGQHVGYGLTFGRVGYHGRHHLGVFAKCGTQLASLHRGGVQHRHRRGLQVIVVHDVMVVSVLAVGLLSYLCLVSLQHVIEAYRLVAQFLSAFPCSSGFRRVLGIKPLQVFELHLVACRHVDIGTVNALLHLAEAVQHIARHVEGQHSRQHDVHQVDHSLTRRHPRHIVTSACHLLSVY